MTVGLTRDDSVSGSGVDDRPRPGVVIVFSGDAPHYQTIPLEDGRLVLGRTPPASEPLPDDRISREHAEVSFDGTQWSIKDLGSRNGTFVNGQEVKGTIAAWKPRALRAGHTIFLLCEDIRQLEGATVVSSEGMVVGPLLRTALDFVAQKARAGENLLITGESGTGKELAAKTFHASGPHSAGPFIAVNCAAIPSSIGERLLFGAKRGAYSGAVADAEGYLQAAHRGVLFLDEVGELSTEVQAKFLRVLETKEVFPLGASRGVRIELRVCSATCRDLRTSLADSTFRQDLYYRIAKPEVTLPPLRERPEEIPWFIMRELQSVDKELVPHGNLIESCLLRPWPGNVRELLSEARHAAQQALDEDSTRVTAEHLAPNAGMVVEKEKAQAPKAIAAREFTREVLEKAIAEQSGSLAAAARALGLHRTQLYRLMKRFGMLTK